MGDLYEEARDMKELFNMDFEKIFMNENMFKPPQRAPGVEDG